MDTKKTMVEPSFDEVVEWKRKNVNLNFKDYLHSYPNHDISSQKFAIAVRLARKKGFLDEKGNKIPESQVPKSPYVRQAERNVRSSPKRRWAAVQEAKDLIQRYIKQKGMAPTSKEFFNTFTKTENEVRTNDFNRAKKLLEEEERRANRPLTVQILGDVSFSDIFNQLEELNYNDQKEMFAFQQMLYDKIQDVLKTCIPYESFKFVPTFNPIGIQCQKVVELDDD